MQPARFQFRALNQWLGGTHSRSTIHRFYGAGAERVHERTFHFDADQPTVMVGQDLGPTPAEYLLHALAACLTMGLASRAAAQGVRLTEVHSTVTGDLEQDRLYTVTVRFSVTGCAPDEELRALVEQSRTRSAVLDILTNPVPVVVEVETHRT
jgi:uncharacterized OsmC-like protein